MKEILYINGDVREPIGEGNKLIIHCCNDIGKMGAGVAMAISRKWTEVRRQYKQWHMGNKGFKLGNIQFVKVESDIVVCNMIGQHGIKTVSKVPPGVE